MNIEFDEAKRQATIQLRGMDMADAWQVFLGPHQTVQDDRKYYGEVRFVTVGYMNGRLVYVAWTDRGGARRIISLRKANEREVARNRL